MLDIVKFYPWMVSEGTNYKILALSPRQSEKKMGVFLEVKLGMPEPYYSPMWYPQFNKGMVTITYDHC